MATPTSEIATGIMDRCPLSPSTMDAGDVLVTTAILLVLIGLAAIAFEFSRKIDKRSGRFKIAGLAVIVLGILLWLAVPSILHIMYTSSYPGC
jgi:hypothetical protein